MYAFSQRLVREDIQLTITDLHLAEFRVREKVELLLYECFDDLKHFVLITVGIADKGLFQLINAWLI